MTAEYRLRRPTEADHPVLVAQVDDWWGGRKLHQLLPRLWLQHFTGTSWVAEDGDGRLVGFLIGFISPDRPGEAYIHMVGTSPNHRGAGLGRMLYERFFEDVRERACTPRERRHLARQPDVRRVPSGDGLRARRRIRNAEPVRDAGLPRLRRRAATTGSSSAGRSDRRRGELLAQEPPEPGRAFRLRDRVEPALEQRLALGVDEDVRPPERMLDELEALLGARPARRGRRRAGRPTTSSCERPRRGGGARRCRRSRPGSRGGPRSRRRARRSRGSAAGSVGARRGRPARRARRGGPRARPAGATNRTPRSARPSLIRHSGVLMSRIDDSRRPCRSTSSASFQACSR